MEGAWLVATLEKHAVLQSPSQIENMVGIFMHATKVRGFHFPGMASWLGVRLVADCLSRWRRNSGISGPSDVASYGTGVCSAAI